MGRSNTEVNKVNENVKLEGLKKVMQKGYLLNVNKYLFKE